MNLPGLDDIVDLVPQPVVPLLNITVHCECVNPDGSIAWVEDVPIVAGPPVIEELPVIHGPPTIAE